MWCSALLGWGGITEETRALPARWILPKPPDEEAVRALAEGAEKDNLIAEKDAIRKELKATGKNFYKKFRTGTR